MKLDSRREIVELILKNLVPKFGKNQLKHDPHQTMPELCAQNDRPLKKQRAQAKGTRRSLQFLKDDVGCHKLMLKFLENLECTSNRREPAENSTQTSCSLARVWRHWPRRF